MIYIGTAGWSVPAIHARHFPKSGSHLVRYAARLKAAEINSSFWRPHQQKTYARWAASVPADFRFSVKLPRAITHEGRLTNYREYLPRFLEETAGLGAKLAVILVQLPPSLALDKAPARKFFRHLVGSTEASIACEPRHATWFTPAADQFLHDLAVVRVAADPARVPAAAEPGGDRRFSYWRLHGSPRLYISNYDRKSLRALASRLHTGDWCVFDNTMSSAALGNAVSLKKLAEKT
jgi:uncharacterized protein YecE (DUF72 family)